MAGVGASVADLPAVLDIYQVEGVGGTAHPLSGFYRVVALTHHKHHPWAGAASGFGQGIHAFWCTTCSGAALGFVGRFRWEGW